MSGAPASAAASRRAGRRSAARADRSRRSRRPRRCDERLARPGRRIGDVVDTKLSVSGQRRHAWRRTTHGWAHLHGLARRCRRPVRTATCSCPTTDPYGSTFWPNAEHWSCRDPARHPAPAARRARRARRRALGRCAVHRARVGVSRRSSTWTGRAAATPTSRRSRRPTANSTAAASGTRATSAPTRARVHEQRGAVPDVARATSKRSAPTSAASASSSSNRKTTTPRSAASTATTTTASTPRPTVGSCACGSSSPTTPTATCC